MARDNLLAETVAKIHQYGKCMKNVRKKKQRLGNC